MNRRASTKKLSSKRKQPKKSDGLAPPMPIKREVDGKVSTSLVDAIVHSTLLNDFVVLLDAYSMAAFCEVLGSYRPTRAIMSDATKWRQWAAKECQLDNIDTMQEHTMAPLIPVPFVCKELAHCITAYRQWHDFQHYVHIVTGDLRKIMSVHGHPVDCLVFPTSAFYMNPGIGVAGAVHQRAGQELATYISDQLQQQRQHGSPGHVWFTPSFIDGIQWLAHCVGPAYQSHRCSQRLYTTYVNAFTQLHQLSDTIQCAAVASISTGQLQYPYEPAALIALQALRDVIRLRPWKTHVGIVCYDKAAYPAFTQAKEVVEAAFHTAPVLFPSILSSFMS